MDWKAISNNVLLVGLFVAMVTMFNQVGGRLDTMQSETNRCIDAVQVEMSRVREEMNRRFDTLQAENQRQHDAMKEVLRVFEGRITRLEEKADFWSEIYQPHLCTHRSQAAAAAGAGKPARASRRQCFGDVA